MHTAYASFKDQLQTESKYKLLQNNELTTEIDNVGIQVLQQLKEEYGDAVYRSWFVHLKFEKIINDELVITTPTKFIKEWTSNNYLGCIKRVLKSLAPSIKRIIITVKAPTLPLIVSGTMKDLDKCKLFDFSLDPNLTFEKFVVDETNGLAHSAVKSLAGNRNAFGSNMLYIQGNIGMGKTHLLQSITAYIKLIEPTCKVLYLSAEKFMQIYIRSIRDNDLVTFKEKLRTSDILLIDDFQFICGKSSTGQELLNTIIALTESSKKVVVACNTSPYNLDLDIRTRSRLTGGLVVNIDPPGYTLRLKVLKSKVAQHNIILLDGILEFIANTITSNVRELEGAFNKLVFYYSIHEGPISLGTAQEILKENIAIHNKVICIDRILQSVANVYGIKVPDLQSRKRVSQFVLPRQIAAYIAKQLTTNSLQEIGMKLGKKDHATVLYSVKKIEGKISTDKSFARKVSDIVFALQNNF